MHAQPLFKPGLQDSPSCVLTTETFLGKGVVAVPRKAAWYLLQRTHAMMGHCCIAFHAMIDHMRLCYFPYFFSIFWPINFSG